LLAALPLQFKSSYTVRYCFV